MGRPNLPDKIYFVIDEKGAHTFLGLQPDDAAEYIRKDALLEWANEQIKVAKANNFAYSPFEKLVDKLNSM